MAGEGPDLEYTPTWMVAITSVMIILISWAVERALHFTGKLFKRKKLDNMYEALEKIKEELMILGFISLLLTVFQGAVEGWCVPEKFSGTWLPCGNKPTSTTSHLQVSNRFLAESSSGSAFSGRCKPGKVPFMSLKAVHDLHIFIFVLAVVQVIITVFTFAAGGYKISRWGQWENAILQKINENEAKDDVIHVQDHEFYKNRFWGIDSYFLSWAHSFIKHIYGSVTKSDYTEMRKGFILKHCRGNPKFNFHKYMLRAFQMDFKDVVGINWYLWILMVILLLLNFAGWVIYFILAFIPLTILLVVGTKLEHVITRLAEEVASKHSVLIGDVEIMPSDDLFWFKKPRILLIFIHTIIFVNSLELAIFFWALFTYKFDSCFIGDIAYLVPRLIIVALVQFVSTYSTLPLYAIVTQMGSSFSIAIFEENVQESLLKWAKQAKKAKAIEKVVQVSYAESSSSSHPNIHSSPSIEIQPTP